MALTAASPRGGSLPSEAIAADEGSISLDARRPATPRLSTWWSLESRRERARSSVGKSFDADRLPDIPRVGTLLEGVEVVVASAKSFVRLGAGTPGGSGRADEPTAASRSLLRRRWEEGTGSASVTTIFPLAPGEFEEGEEEVARLRHQRATLTSS